MTKERKREINAKYYQAKKQEILTYRKSKYKPEEAKLRAKRHHQEHRSERNSRTKARDQELKLIAFTTYGGAKCSLCPETRIAALHIDHISGGGNNHRKEIKQSIYNWLKKHKYPNGFRVLCANCNIREYRKSIELSLNQSIESAKGRERIKKVKQLFMNKIGGSCVVCGEADLDILTVHHIKNDGANHRRMVSKGKGGRPFYHSVLRSGKYDGLECRCYSCNISA